MNTETPRGTPSSVTALDNPENPTATVDVVDRGSSRRMWRRKTARPDARARSDLLLDRAVGPTRRRFTSPSFMVAYFGALNVIMYLTIHKFWIGGSSFLPMIGRFGEGNKFLFAFIVNIGVILGAFVGAYVSGEFHFRIPAARNVPKAIIGGALIGMGVTVAPGTCTTSFVTGIPMLSVSSFLSAAGIFIGSYIVYHYTLRRR